MTVDDLKLVLAIGNQPWPVVYGIWRAPVWPDTTPATWLAGDGGTVVWSLVPHVMAGVAATYSWDTVATYRVAIMPPDSSQPTSFFP